MMLSEFIGSSDDVHNVIKQRILGAVEFYLRRISVDAEEMQRLRRLSSFDLAAFNLFEGIDVAVEN